MGKYEIIVDVWLSQSRYVWKEGVGEGWVTDFHPSETTPFGFLLCAPQLLHTLIENGTLDPRFSVNGMASVASHTILVFRVVPNFVGLTWSWFDLKNSSLRRPFKIISSIKTSRWCS
jgi:hypothetical protein